MILCSTTRVITRAIAVIALFACALSAGQIHAQGNALAIANASANGAQPVALDVSLTNDSEVQGFILAVGFDTAQLSVLDFTVVGTVTDAVGAELVSAEIFEIAGGATLGVVLDTMMPFAGQTIPVGSNQTIARLQMQADQIPAAGSVVTPVGFVDATFNTPTLDNLLVLAGGVGVSAANGLGLTDGSVEIFAQASSFELVGATLEGASSGTAQVLFDSSAGGVQGYVVAVSHDAATLDLVDININGTITNSVGADLVVANLFDNGGTLGVVLDFDPPFQGQVIPDGDNQLIANYVYVCDNPIIVAAGDPIPPSDFSSIQFQDGTLGTPALDNVIVVAGASVAPILGGSATIECAPFIDNGGGPATTTFFCGVQDPSGDIVDAVTTPGGTTELCFYYTEGVDNGQSCIGNNIQGFQMALTFDCNLDMVQGSFSISGTILDFVGTEFVTHSVDNDPNDGDGCELTIGILLDALPPFDGQTLPPSCTPARIGCIDVIADANAPCNSCLPVTFTNGVNGSESVEINNVVAIDNQGFQGVPTVNCNVCIEAAREFVRGDCNFDNFVNIADAAAVVSLQFQGAQFPCFDACDANDDGFINLADTVFLLAYLFDSGPVPPSPGPDLNDGPDPTADFLSCAGGTDPCP